MDNLSFEELNLSGQILEAVHKLGYRNPSKVQQQVIPKAMENKDIIVKSQTGSGKTASFAIPLCESVDIEERDPQALVLTPTRELCVQVKEEIANIGRLKRVRAAAVFGKQPFSDQARELKQRTHIVVGTPGRTLDHIDRGSITLDKIKYLVIDEADEMLNMGFIDQVEDVIKKLPKNRVTMLFSATISEEIDKLCGKYMNDPMKIEVNPERITTERIKHICYKVGYEYKFNLLKDILIVENIDSSIIFCSTKENVDEVSSKLSAQGFPCDKLHGGMMQKDRLDVMNAFKRGKFRILVATDVAARGIDVQDVSHIINYDIPMEKESYVHRTGRTARAGKQGKAITFVNNYDNRFLLQIEEYLGFNLEREEIPSKDLVNDLKKDFLDKLNTKPVLKKDKSSELNKQVYKIYINAGKKKKIRPGDIVGAILSVEGLTSDDIGIIDIQDGFSYIDILNGKGSKVLDGLNTNITIKGKSVKAQRAKK
ncbi:ATP-dependent RNA helicase DbpA [Clostridium zeae]|uniref:ATP-dependent RNA helicase DbpA n=1 Tax=Clostridium zeae TaxID=2759022 RepID=A0ABQ1EDX0_9CLOT|nr:DEAD/DEAH box helicase [Clostridium zeae]GFZ32790.1 ATP-dependent RNA helicase DbpA [Clostridium zeae]